MAEREQKYEEKPLLAPDDELEGEQLYPIIPPPAYEPMKAAIPTQYVMDTSMPLPSYEQSEKYEKEGVLEYTDRLEGTVRIVSRQSERPVGTWLEFISFFVGCLLFSWLGYLISCCLATTIAAQSGAAAGLGLSLVLKTIIVEFHPTYFSTIANQMCLDEYYSTPDDEYSNSCTKGTYSFVRLLFWILGFMGLFLFARGISVFCQSRPTPVRNENNIIP